LIKKLVKCVAFNSSLSRHSWRSVSRACVCRTSGWKRFSYWWVWM